MENQQNYSYDSKLNYIRDRNDKKAIDLLIKSRIGDQLQSHSGPLLSPLPLNMEINSMAQQNILTLFLLYIVFLRKRMIKNDIDSL